MTLVGSSLLMLLLHPHLAQANAVSDAVTQMHAETTPFFMENGKAPEQPLLIDSHEAPYREGLTRAQGSLPDSGIHSEFPKVESGELQISRIELAYAASAKKPASTSSQEQDIKRRMAARPRDTMIRFEYANFLFRNGRREQSLVEYNKILAKEPTNSDYLIGKSRVLLSLGKVPEAQTLLKKAIRISPRYADAWKLLIQSCGYPGSTINCEQIEKQAAAIFPGAWWLKGMPPRDVNGRFDKAWLEASKKQIQQLLAKSPNNMELLYRQAQLELWDEQFDAAIAIYDRLIKQSPRDPDYTQAKANALVERGRYLLRQGNIPDAQAQIESAIQLAPTLESAHRLMMTTCNYTGNTRDCAPDRQRATAIFPNAYWLKGDPPRDQNGQYDQQWLSSNLAELRSYLQTHPDDQAAYYKLAHWLSLDNQFEESLKLYNQLIQASPYDGDYPISKADVLVRKARYQLQQDRVNNLAAAQITLKQALQVQPDYEPAYRLLVNTCGSEANTMDCQPYVDMAQTLYPDAFWLQGAPPMDAEGRPDKQWLAANIQKLETYLQKRPDDEQGVFRLALWYTADEQFDKALTLMDKLIAQAPRDPGYVEAKSNIYVGWARTLLNANQVAEAQQQLQQAITIAPNNESAHRMLVSTCGVEGSTLDCQMVTQQANAIFPGAYWLDGPPPKDKDGVVYPAWLAKRIGDLQAYIQQRPSDVDARYYLSRLYLMNNEHDKAIAEMDTLIAQSPNDADYQIAKARLLNIAGRPDEAIALISQLEQKGIDSADAAEVRLQSYVRKKDWDTLRQEQPLVASNYPGRDWSMYHPRNIDGAHVRQALSYSFGYEDLDNRQRSWTEQNLIYTAQFPNRVRVMAGASRYNRFGRDDWMYEAGLSVPLGSRFSYRTEWAVGPDNLVLPSWYMLHEIGTRLPYGFGAYAAFRHVNYRGRHANAGLYTLEKYLGPWRLAYSLFNTHIEDTGVANTHLANLTRYYGDRNSIGLTLSTGRSLENIQPQGILNNKTYGATLRGEHYVTSHWGVSYGVFINVIESIFTRKGFQIGLKRVF